MNIQAYREQLFSLEYACGVNQRYHKILEWRWGMGEKAVKVLMGVMAVCGLIVTMPDMASLRVEVAIGILSVISALALNVMPLGDREKFHGEMFRRWSDLRSDVETEDVKVERKVRTDRAGDVCIERLEELLAKKVSLNASESHAFGSLLHRCQEDENQCRYGVRDYASAKAVCDPSAAAVPAGSGAGAGVAG